MSLLSDLKKLLFGAKAVGKSAAQKATEKGADSLEEAKTMAGEGLEKVQRLAEDIGEKAMETAETVGKKILDVAGVEPTQQDDDVMDDILKEVSTPKVEKEAIVEQPTQRQPMTEDARQQREAMENPLTTHAESSPEVSDSSSNSNSTEELLQKIEQELEKLGKQMSEKGGQALEKAKDIASDWGEKLLAARDELVRKAEEEAAKSGEVPKDFAEKLAEINKRIQDAISGNNQQFADKPLDLGGSELEKHGSFFEKARRFAEGEYQSKKTRIEGEASGPTKKPAEVKKGFEDLDGDGDEIIDDAILDEEN